MSTHAEAHLVWLRRRRASDITQAYQARNLKLLPCRPSMENENSGRPGSKNDFDIELYPSTESRFVAQELIA